MRLCRTPTFVRWLPGKCGNLVDATSSSHSRLVHPLSIVLSNQTLAITTMSVTLAVHWALWCNDSTTTPTPLPRGLRGARPLPSKNKTKQNRCHLAGVDDCYLKLNHDAQLPRSFTSESSYLSSTIDQNRNTRNITATETNVVKSPTAPTPDCNSVTPGAGLASGSTRRNTPQNRHGEPPTSTEVRCSAAAAAATCRCARHGDTSSHWTTAPSRESSSCRCIRDNTKSNVIKPASRLSSSCRQPSKMLI